MSGHIEQAFRDVVRQAESQFGVLLPVELEALCRRSFYTGAVEAASLIECHGVTPREIVAEHRAAFPDDREPTLRSNS
jgi:hypothetical protein